MGMAASQARYLSLTARKTNVEYEGQQVNQERTALANQSAGLFNQMLALEVPTPPSASDYSKTQYVFTDNQTTQKYTIDSIYKNPTPDENGDYKYTVSAYKNTTDILANRSSIVSQGQGTNRYTIAEDPSNPGTYTIQIGNNTAKTLIAPKQYTALTSKFQEADQKTNGGQDNITDDTYYFKFVDGNTEYYIPAASGEETFEQLMERGLASGSLPMYSAQSTAKSEYVTYNDAVMELAGDGTGRFKSITFTNENGNQVRCDLTQQTVQDDDAYDAAMETYTAQKSIYEKAVADINAQTTIIQQQDKTLELHLDQLDTEQQAIQTEMDAVKKVIDKNIEETFKTFA
ncbi:MAG: hypothetical protein ACLSUS_05750 [Opitutales bacterium]